MNLSILLRHGGIWESDIVYSRYKSDGIVVGDNISFSNLRAAIAAELGIDEQWKEIKIRYVVEGNASPISIRNDMGVKLYVEIKKSEPGFGMYPLCVDTINSDRDDTSMVDASCGIIESESMITCYVPDVDVSNIICDSTNVDVKVKNMYKDKATLVDVMARYKVQRGFNFKIKRSDRESYVLKCFSDDCCWSMKSSCRKNTEIFKIRYFNDTHTCMMRERMLNKVEATLSFVSGVTAPKLVNHKRIHTPNDIIHDVQAAYGVDIPYQKAWRAKERALDMLRGKPADGYRQLPKYMHMLNTIYPNSYIRMLKSPTNEFMYLFIALRPLIRGFQFCRPVVVVDGAHLSSAYKGTFISASTLDGAGSILPLAYGVVDTENDSSWSWFFQQFKNSFGERENLCFVSDRNESIMKSVSNVFPNCPHYACIWHLWKNICTNYRKSKSALSDKFYAMAKCYRMEDFNKIMAKVVKIDHRVKEYLENAGYEKWSRVHAPVNRGQLMTSNIAECINGCLVEARKLPIIDFLEETGILFGSWNCKNRETASYTKETLGRKYENILVANIAKCSHMKVVPSSEYVFSVYDGSRRFIVCVERKTCTCGKFQIDEIPCPHAIAVLKNKNVVDMHPYCSDYYKPKALSNTYEVPMVPMPDRADWNVPSIVLEEVVFPPKYKRLPGRPKKGRKKSAGEKIPTTSNCCSTCGHEGHNRRTCSFFPKEK